MKKPLLLTVISCFLLQIGQSQVKMGDNLNSISPGSLLELESTSRALTLPRMTTTQMQAIASPLPGMLVFNTDSNCLYLYRTGNLWSSLMPAAAGNTAAWPYQTADGVPGSPGNAKGIVSIPGAGLQASGAYSHAEGLNSVASGMYSWSIGFADTASGAAAMALGHQNNVPGFYGFSAGSRNIAAGQSSIALGQENADSGWASMAMGLRNQIHSQAAYSNTLGYNNRVLAGWSNNALGENNQLRSGRANTAVGMGNGTDGSQNFISGRNNNNTGGNANWMGGEDNRILSGNDNIVSGLNNEVSGSYLGAFGKDNAVTMQSAFAFGQGNRDSGYASIAAGQGNIIGANSQYSFAAGQANIVSPNTSLLNTIPGAGTFSAGISNRNGGYGSAAIGVQNRSTGMYSIAGNYNSMANSSSMSAFGHFNDTTAAYPGNSNNPQEILFAIGNGLNDANRRNALTMLRNGHTSINATSANGPAVPRAELDVRGTGAMIVPVGTQAERPQAPVTGMIRFCSDCPGGPVLQGYNGTEWVNL